MSPLTNKRAIIQLRRAIQNSTHAGNHSTISERFYHLKSLVEIGGVHTLEPLLPLCLSLNGKPYDLKDHFAFSPFYKTRMPSQMVVVAGRQVAKSSNLAAHGVLLSNAIPFFRTLFITPLYEQIRRFSNNYVSTFVSQSPVKALWTGTSTKNSVLNKTFRNSSSMTFSFTGTDCDRIRGISTDCINLDESVRLGTMVSGPDGSRPVETLLPGDKIHAFDENGNCQEDTVVTCSDHGVRDCYKIELEDGSCVEATSDSFVATTAGWKRVSTVITDWCTDTYAAGDHAGRRKHDDNEQKSEIHEPSRVQAARIQSGEVPGIIRVRTYTTQESGEQGLREMVESVGNTNGPRTMAYSVFVSPQRGETGNPSMAGSADLGGCGVVVSGRRQPQRSQSDLSYAGILSGGGFSPSFLADAEWYSSNGSTTKEPEQPGAGLLDSSSGCGCNIRTNSEATPIHRAVDAVQDQPTRSQYDAGLFDMRAAVSCLTTAPGKIQCYSEGSMPRTRLQTEESQSKLRKELHAGTENYSATTATGTVQGGRRREAQGGCRERAAVPPAKSRRCDSVQKEVASKRTRGKTSATVDMSEMPAAGAPRTQGRKDKVLSSMSKNCDTGATRHVPVRLASAEIASISWTGKHRVFDIATKEYRTFFAGGVAVHNCQDLDSDHFPIIRETMSHSKWSLTKFTGTPKTLDNTIHGLWQRSSQAEWVIPCTSCRTWNFPCLSLHLEAMIGPLRDDISEDLPGVVCHKCCKPIRPREGHWVHRYPDKRWDFAGYHVPQIIMPLHYASYKKWDELLAKQRGWGNYTQARFYNEVLGESVDAGQQLVSETELRRAGSLPWKNNPNVPDKAVMARLGHYTMRVLAVDWGGGGEAGVSFTTMALLGYAPDGKIHCLWGKRLVASQEHLREARELLHWTRVFAPDLVVHDYTGAGVVREGILVQAGFDLNRVMPIEYIRAGTGNMLRYIEPTVLHNRGRYRLDKTRSLLWTCQAIKLNMLQFFEYDYINDDNSGLMHDFLALVEEKTESRLAGDIYTIVRNQMLSDDFAQAVNIGCCALWHATGNWPNFAQAAAVGQISLAGLQAFDNYAWSDRDGSSTIFDMP